MSVFRRKLMKKQTEEEHIYLDMSKAVVKGSYIAYSNQLYNIANTGNYCFSIMVEPNYKYKVIRDNPVDVDYYRFRGGVSKGMPVNKAQIYNYVLNLQDTNQSAIGKKGIDVITIESTNYDCLTVFYCTSGCCLTQEEIFKTITIEKLV